MPITTKEKIRKTLQEKYKNSEYKERIAKKIKQSMTLQVRKKMRLAHTNRTNYYFNIDFFIKTRSFMANRSFISLMKKIPNNTYFIIAVKDDAQRNLFNSTKKFIYNVLHSKHIYDLQYRDSWCALLYKDGNEYPSVRTNYQIKIIISLFIHSSNSYIIVFFNFKINISYFKCIISFIINSLFYFFCV